VTQIYIPVLDFGTIFFLKFSKGRWSN